MKTPQTLSSCLARALTLAISLCLLGAGCATTHKSVGVGVTRDAHVLPVGVSYTTSAMHATPIDALQFGPTARYKIGPSAIDIGLGAELMLRPPDDYHTPGFRVGFDALNMGCTDRTCFGGTGGVHGGFDFPVYHGPKQHIMLDLTLDHDVRIGPASSTTLLFSVRFIPRQRET